jgi:hypoxanthine phosphoribosyltransferase
VFLPNKGRFRCDMPSWRRVVRDSKTLSSLIKNSGFDPNIVVAISRGGLVPARLVCDFLHIKDLTTIKVEHWGMVATPTEKAVIKFPLYVDIKDKRVLLVDDITDTGDTLRVSLEHLKRFKPKEIRTAVLIHKIISAFQPDYYVRKITQWRWVIFPWHVWEDLTGFIKSMKAIGICCEEDIRRELKSKYNIEVQIETIKEILSEIG